ncbi:MAG: hypothetical protein KKA73_23280 [Chloroflexi bacterium]|nr:hypothetical protein [Chloroflexota bacterium]MBU1750614.1 hypothetical protein [Chloroflexota bacterium]
MQSDVHRHGKSVLAGVLVGGALLVGAYGAGSLPANSQAVPVAVLTSTSPARTPGPSPSPPPAVTPSPTRSSAPVSTPTTPAASPTVALPRSIPVRAYRFAVQTTRLDGSDPQTMTVQGAWTGESLHTITTVVLADGNREETEVYVVDGRTVWRTGAGPWQTVQNDTVPPDKLDINRLLVQARAGAGLDLEFVETVIVRGVVCQKYQYRTLDGSDREQGFVYVSVASGLIHRLEGEIIGPTGPTARLLLEQWDYNTDIVIQLPV